MERAALVRYITARGAYLRERGGRTEVYATTAGAAAVPLRSEIDSFLVESICRALAIEEPPGLTKRPRRTLGREKVVIRVPSDSRIVIERDDGGSGTPRGGGRGRKRKSRG